MPGRRPLVSTILTEESAHAAFVRNHARLIAAIFGVPDGHVPMSDETPLFEPCTVPGRDPARRGKKGGRRC